VAGVNGVGCKRLLERRDVPYALRDEHALLDHRGSFLDAALRVYGDNIPKKWQPSLRGRELDNN
jgi:hypothetical protein